jgi:phosphinothricin acetyltransferase
MEIRDALAQDFEPITALYNEIVTTSTATYNDRPATVDERIEWAHGRREQGYPVLVAAENNRFLGFASFGNFRVWPGYRFTVECTVYVHSSHRGKGIGTALVNGLVARARALGKHAMIAAVDFENHTSLQFLARFGFQRAGLLPEVGFKFDRFHDLVLLHYRLTQPQAPSKRAGGE